MNPNRYNQSYYQTYDNNPLIDNYKSVARDLIKLQFPLLGMDEIDAALDWSISKRITDHNVQIDNNYKKQSIDMKLLDVAKYILDRQPILTSYGVMFKRHGEVPNPLYKLIDDFIKNRKVLKKEMFKFPRGSSEFEKYNLLQLLAKIKSVSLYRNIWMQFF